jgi:hypothetical protein
MALVKTTKIGPPRHSRGQGVIEAIVALPVFLVLVCLTFQIFFLAIARVQLQYAAFYAARAGIVHDGDIRIMEDTASRILAVSPALSSFRRGSLKVSLTYPEAPEDYQSNSRPNTQSNPRSDSSKKLEPNRILTVHLTWEYPLILPLANRLLGKPNALGFLAPVSTVPLQASWTMGMQDKPHRSGRAGTSNDR